MVYIADQFCATSRCRNKRVLCQIKSPVAISVLQVRHGCLQSKKLMEHPLWQKFTSRRHLFVLCHQNLFTVELNRATLVMTTLLPCGYSHVWYFGFAAKLYMLAERWHFESILLSLQALSLPFIQNCGGLRMWKISSESMQKCCRRGITCCPHYWRNMIFVSVHILTAIFVNATMADDPTSLLVISLYSLILWHRFRCLGSHFRRHPRLRCSRSNRSGTWGDLHHHRRKSWCKSQLKSEGKRKRNIVCVVWWRNN